MEIIAYLICVAVLVIAGIYEKKQIKKNVDKIPLRVNVNGIRGKSTATRFITAILEEAGYKVIGKTTGTSARMIFWGMKKEIPIKRRPVGPNIGEQVAVLKQAGSRKADALVCECMAVKPEYQEIYQKEIIQANIVVITNVVEDHLDEMGPTTDQIAWAFAKTIPYEGILVITEGKYANYFKKVAEKRKTKVVCLDPEIIPQEYIDKFPYIVFKNNCAIGLGVAHALGIKPEVALSGMLKAHPDPGIAQIVPVERNGKNAWLVNAFAANEPTSSLEIWKNITTNKIKNKESVLILCCRDDRVDRTKQFIDDFLPYIRAKHLLLIGTGTIEVTAEYKKNRFEGIEECIDLTGNNEHEIINRLDEVMDDRIIFCAGNIHGVAEKFLEDLVDIKI